jgi:GTP-binding protein Era
MLQEVYEALETRDVVLVLMDATRRVQLEAAAGPASGPALGSATEEHTAGAEAHDDFADSDVGAKAPTYQPGGDSTANLSATSEVPTPKRERTNWASEDEFLFGLIRKLDCPVFLVLTKIDLVPKDHLLPLIDTLTRQFNFAQIIPVSARKRDGLDILVRKIVEALPTGERYYPKEQYTDQPQRFMVAELIRESILVETGEEVPYSAAVVIERFEEPPVFVPRKKGAVPARAPLTRIAAAIYCERDGQKAILIGKGGVKLKEIGARGGRSSRCSGRAFIWNCMSSSNRTGASRRALLSRSTGGINWNGWPEIRSQKSIWTKTNRTAPQYPQTRLHCFQ